MKRALALLAVAACSSSDPAATTTPTVSTPVSDAGATPPKTTTNDAGSPADGGTTETPEAGAAGCTPVRAYTFTLGATVALACDTPMTIFDQTIADTGRAVAHANLQLVGAGNAGAGVHGWTGGVKVGDPAFANQITFAAGEDLCPGEQLTRHLLSYGSLTAASNHVSLALNAYRSNACQNGVVTVAAGSTLEVFVEDASDACVGKDIVAKSYFQTIWAKEGQGTSDPVAMTTSFTNVLDASLTTTATANLRVLGQLEMSPASTANTCGNRAQTGVAAIVRNGSYLGVDTQGYPTSGGETHLLLGPDVSFPNEPAGALSFSIAGAVNQTAQAGAPVGATFSGDTILAIVATRAAH